MAVRLGAGERIRFAGFTDPGGLPDAYAELDAVIFPVRWNEPFGLVPLEAMAMGRPVISTLRGGTAEFVRDGENALTFEPDDVSGLARAIRRLAGDEALRRKLRAEGRRTAERFGRERFAERVIQRIVDVVPRSEPGKPRG